MNVSDVTMVMIVNIPVDAAAVIEVVQRVQAEGCASTLHWVCER
jgi:hypothetical protein